MSNITQPTERNSQRKYERRCVSKIVGHRRGEHSDLPALDRLASVKTYDIFGDIEIGRPVIEGEIVSSESSCLSVVQYNEKGDVTSGIFLSNYPNVPSVHPEGWFHWLKAHYGIDNVTERGTMFVHCLVWDDLYAEQFFEDLLVALFDMDVYICQVILVLPPRVIPALVVLFHVENAFARHMIRNGPIGLKDSYMVQALYTIERYSLVPRLKIRRAVEEDNDDIVPVIEADSSYMREVYGEYYISEMTRHPDDRRRIIVSEDGNGLATGAMCLNSRIELDLLNENFELTVYSGGLRKIDEIIGDEIIGDEIIGDEIIGAEIIGDDEIIGDRDDTGTSDLEKTIGESISATFAASSSDTGESKGEEQVQDEAEYSRAGTSLWDGDNRKSSARSVKFTEVVLAAIDVAGETPKDGEIEEIYRRRRLSSKEEKRVRIDDAVYNNDVSMVSQTRSNEDDSFKWKRKDLDRRRISKEEIPSDSVHHSEPDAFVVEIFAVRRDIGNRGTREFLEAAFESFPNLDYCVLLLPPAYSYFSLLDHFVRVPLKADKDFPMTLYLAHRAVLFGKIRTRKANWTDEGTIKRFLRDIPKSKEIMEDFSRSISSVGDVISCIMESEDVIVGLAVLCIDDDVNNREDITTSYRLEDFLTSRYIRRDAYGCLLHFVLMPIFSVHQRFFLCEIMRLNGLTVLYYRLYEEEDDSLETRTRPIISCLHAMLPVNLSKRIKYQFDTYLEEVRNCEMHIKESREKASSLFLTTPRIATIPRRIVDVKIVVVGASDCGLAFLEFLTLEYSQNLVRFTNLTLISRNGLPYKKRRDDSIILEAIPFKGRYCRNYRRHLIAGRASINVVSGTVTAINRDDKYVTVMDQGALSYDYLILTCGLQYQKTLFRKKRLDMQKEKGNGIKLEIIRNCLTINDDTEEFVSLEKIRLATNDFKEKKSIVLYGHNIDCYCALRGLTKHGIKGSWITLIEPRLNRCVTHDSVFFSNCEVNEAIMNGILEDDITVLSGWNVIDWTLENCDNDEKTIKSIVIRSGTMVKTVPCDIFFNFYEKEIDTHSFLAICRAGLVFDGWLIINPEFLTNDPFVFAAGTVTRYATKFHGEFFEHKYCNSIEIGERLGKIVRKVVETYQEYKGRWEASLDRSKSSMILADLRSPVVVSCTLPGDHSYLHVEKPGKKLPRDIAIRLNTYGDVMITGSCSSDIGYFRLRLNARAAVESITCCTKKTFQVSNFIALYGKHDSMLNELKYRFQKSLISDFYAYFEEPWAIALFHDRFECLRVENRAIFLSKTNFHTGTDSLLEDCVLALSKTKGEGMSQEDRELITRRYVGSVYQQEIEKNVIDFLQYFEQDLPTYCTPRLMRWLYADIESSPLFFSKE